MPDLLTQCSLPPVLLLIVSLCQRRYGPALGGLLAGLPLTSGPVVFLTALHGGDALAARTALTTLEGVGPVCVLCLVYARAARRYAPRRAAAVSVTAFAATAGLLEALRTGPGIAIPVGVLVLAAATAAWPESAAAPSASTGGMPLGVRMLLVTGYVMAVCLLTWRLGPGAIGPFAPFPVLVATQVTQTHRTQGADAAGLFLRAVLRAEWAFLASFLLLSSAIPAVGTAGGFALALAGGAATQYAVTRLERGTRERREARAAI